MQSRPFQGWSMPAPWMACLLFGCAAHHPAAVSPASPAGEVGPPAAAVHPTSLPIHPSEPRVTELGRSVEGRPLTLYVFGDDPADHDQRPVLILGGIHGNEPTSAGVCRELVTHLTAHPEAWA